MFVLPDLPYGLDALAPLISAETLTFHHGKHHKAYVDKANALAAKAGLAGHPLEDVVREARRLGDQALFNNAAQAWNHALFWNSMRPPGGGGPEGGLAAAIETFGGLPDLREAFVAEGAGHFASGWVWLVSRGEALEVISTHDADDTLAHPGVVPLLVCDVWEHAYYIDYRNDRAAFLQRWFDGLANWDFAAAQLAAAHGAGEAWRHPRPVEAPARP